MELVFLLRAFLGLAVGGAVTRRMGVGLGGGSYFEIFFRTGRGRSFLV